MEITGHKSYLAMLSLCWLLQLLSPGVLSVVTSAPQGCSVYQIGPGSSTPLVSFRDSLVISNLLLKKGDVINLQVHLYNDQEKHQAEIFIRNDGLVINRYDGSNIETLASSNQSQPPAPSELYWQQLVINHTDPTTIQVYNSDAKEKIFIAENLNKAIALNVSSLNNTIVALQCIKVNEVLMNDPTSENIVTTGTSKENVLEWRESIAWLLLLMSALCIIFLSVALCMRRRALTSIQSIVPRAAKFLKRTSSVHPREPSTELKADANVQIRREPEEVSDPSEISTTGNYIEEIQPPPYISKVTETTSRGPCESSSISCLDQYHESQSSGSLSNATDISHVSGSSLHRSQATEQSYLAFDSSYGSQNIQSMHSKVLSNGTLPSLSNGFK